MCRLFESGQGHILIIPLCRARRRRIDKKAAAEDDKPARMTAEEKDRIIYFGRLLIKPNPVLIRKNRPYSIEEDGADAPVVKRYILHWTGASTC